MSRRVFGAGLLVLAAICMPLGTVSAQTVSVTQTITVTATVAPARSIIVDDNGHIIKIYSNTADNVTPQVYLHDKPGPSRPLTPGLYEQYKKLISQQKNLVGVEIPVQVPVANSKNLPSILMKSLSSLTGTLSL